MPAWAQFLPLQINKAKNEKVENLNKIFTEVQRDVKSVSKSVAPEPKKQTQVHGLNVWTFTKHFTPSNVWLLRV